MSLIKVAMDNLLKHLAMKPKHNFLTQRLQRAHLAGFANIEAELRRGNTINKGAISSRLGKTLGSQTLEAAHALPGTKGKIAQRVLNEMIDNEGKYKIEHIEHALNKSKLWHDRADKIMKYTPVTAMGLTGGAALGYAKGEKGHKLKSTLRGAAKGTAIGGSVQGGMQLIRHNPYYKNVPKLHKLYFEDNYWRNQLEKVNKGKHFGKMLGEWTTVTPQQNAAKAIYHKDWSNLMHTNVKDVKGLWHNTKQFGKSYGQSFLPENV